MRIFKRGFSEELTKGMSIGECIITKVNDSEYGNFLVLRKISPGEYCNVGYFPLLQSAIEYASSVEKTEDRFEYYVECQDQVEEG